MPNSSYTIGDTSFNYDNYCFWRLPCGICQRTNQVCPRPGYPGTPHITWTSSTGTTATVKSPVMDGTTTGTIN